MNSFFPLLKVGFDLNLKCCFHEDAQFPLASLQAARYTYVLLSLPLQGFSLYELEENFGCGAAIVLENSLFHSRQNFPRAGTSESGFPQEPPPQKDTKIVNNAHHAEPFFT